LHDFLAPPAMVQPVADRASSQTDSEGSWLLPDPAGTSGSSWMQLIEGHDLPEALRSAPSLPQRAGVRLRGSLEGGDRLDMMRIARLDGERLSIRLEVRRDAMLTVRDSRGQPLAQAQASADEEALIVVDPAAGEPFPFLFIGVGRVGGQGMPAGGNTAELPASGSPEFGSAEGGPSGVQMAAAGEYRLWIERETGEETVATPVLGPPSEGDEFVASDHGSPPASPAGLLAPSLSESLLAPPVGLGEMRDGSSTESPPSASERPSFLLDAGPPGGVLAAARRRSEREANAQPVVAGTQTSTQVPLGPSDEIIPGETAPPQFVGPPRILAHQTAQDGTGTPPSPELPPVAATPASVSEESADKQPVGLLQTSLDRRSLLSAFRSGLGLSYVLVLTFMLPDLAGRIRRGYGLRKATRGSVRVRRAAGSAATVLDNDTDEA
jgi:hypothetical protein